MELGFRDDYFARALAAAGWFGRKVALPGADRLCVWEARHRAAAVFRFDASDPRIHTQVGRRHDGAIVFTGAARGTGLYGPYIDLPAGSYVARIVFRPGAPLRGRAAIDIASDAGAKCRARGIINTSAGTSEVAEITFASDTDLSQVEVRMFCEPGFIGTVESVAIAPIDPGA
jgi:hypothetical protein